MPVCKVGTDLYNTYICGSSPVNVCNTVVTFNWEVSILWLLLSAQEN